MIKVLVQMVLELCNLFEGPHGFSAGPDTNKAEIPSHFEATKRDFETIKHKHKYLKDYVHWA